MKEKIAVLLGGPSSEREISIKSGLAVYEALLSLGMDVICIDVSDNPIEQLRRQNADIAFIALHGRFGEDGAIQAMLEQENIPYTGSGPEASRLAMDKLASRKIFKDAGLPVPKTVELLNFSSHLRSWQPPFLPLVVKPNREGSSIGLSVVSDVRNLSKAIYDAFSYDEEIVIEEFIAGDEITVGILDEKPLPVIHIKPKRGVYDFTAKYTEGMAEYVVPAKFKDSVINQAKELGLIAHNLLGCRCFSRVDMRLGGDGEIRILEVNTIPGLTSTSLLPKAAKAVGIDFAHMCRKMVESAKIETLNRYG